MTNDCTKCVHRGRIDMGKLYCHELAEPVEPFEGNYPMAKDCPCYKEVSQ